MNKPNSFLSKHAERIRPFLAMEILEASMKLQASGVDVVSLALGEPDLPVHPAIMQACVESLNKGEIRYTHPQGLESLRQKVCDHYKKKYGVSVTPDRVMITPGTSPAYFVAFSALLNAGDEVIIPNPYYPCDFNFVFHLHGSPVLFPVKASDDYQWNVDGLKKIVNKKTKSILVTSPSNPTGTILKKEVLQQIAKCGPVILSDEIYHGLTYGETCHSMLEFTDQTIVINGFSKVSGMTGFRLGYMIIPPGTQDTFKKIMQNFFISVPVFAQRAAEKALELHDQILSEAQSVFAERRTVMLEGLKDLGFEIPYNPNGAFYVFVNASHLGEKSLPLAQDILQKAHVALTPGIDFGTEGEGHLRFSYVASKERIREAMRRLQGYINL